MRLSHNLSSLNAYRAYSKSLKSQSKALNNISTGNKLNKAGDHPNKVAQSERFKLQVRALNMASRNAQDGISMLQSAEASLDSATSQLQRLRELLIQSGGTMSDEDKVAIEGEMDQMIEGMSQAMKYNDFNGVNILVNKDVEDNKHPKSIKMPVGSDIGEEIEIPVFNFTAEALGLKDEDGNSKINLKDINSSLELVDSAIDTVVSARSRYGAIANTFESRHEALIEIGARIEGADSVISGADIAEESLEFSRTNILVESGIAILAQSNRMPQDALRILENVRSR